MSESAPVLCMRSAPFANKSGSPFSNRLSSDLASLLSVRLPWSSKTERKAGSRPKEAGGGAAVASSGRLGGRASKEVLSGLKIWSSERNEAALGAAASSSW